MGVVLHTHSVHGEPRIQRNASREVATPVILIFDAKAAITFELK